MQICTYMSLPFLAVWSSSFLLAPCMASLCPLQLRMAKLSCWLLLCFAMPSRWRYLAQQAVQQGHMLLCFSAFWEPLRQR